LVVGQQPVNFEVLAQVEAAWRVKAGVALPAGIHAGHDPVSEFDPLPRAILADIRAQPDDFTGALNVLRKERGSPLIPTMQEAQQNVRQQRETFVIEEKLALMPKPPRKAADLKPALLSIGCEVPRLEIARDTVSILKPKKKKAKRYGILELLRGVDAELQRLKAAVDMPDRANPNPLPRGHDFLAPGEI